MKKETRKGRSKDEALDRPGQSRVKHEERADESKALRIAKKRKQLNKRSWSKNT